MVDVVSRRCDSPGCKRQPSGTTDTAQVQFCSLHRGDGRAGYTLLMLAQRERIEAAAALEETQKQQRVHAPSSGAWPGEEIIDYRPRWEAASSGSSGGASFSSGQPTPGSSGTFPNNPSGSGSFLNSQHNSSGSFPAGNFLSNQRRNSDGGVSSGQGSSGRDMPQTTQPWLWTGEPHGSSVGARRPPPLKHPEKAGVLGIAGRPSPPLDSTRGDSPGTEWGTPSSSHSTNSGHPAMKRHCSPRRSFSHSPEPASRTMLGLTNRMAGLQASSPSPSPNMGPIMGMGSATTSSPSRMAIPTPPGSSGSAALPPPHGAPRRSAQRLPHPQLANRGLPRSTGGPPRPPRSLSPGGMPTARSNESFYALPNSGRSPGGGVGYSPSGQPSASSTGGFSGVFSPGSVIGSTMSGGGLNSTRSSVSSTGPSPRWASPRHRAFGHSRTPSQSQGSVGDTLEDLSIVDPGPPTLEPLRVFSAAEPLRSPRDRWRGGPPERRNSDIILPLPDRTQPDPAPGPSTDGLRRSFTASLFDQPSGRTRSREDAAIDAPADSSEGGSGGIASGGSNRAVAGNGGDGSNIGGARWTPAGSWNSSAGEGRGTFQATSDGHRQHAWPQHMQAESGRDDNADTHVEAKEARMGSHVSVGTTPLTSSESIENRESSLFFSAEP